MMIKLLMLKAEDVLIGKAARKEVVLIGPPQGKEVEIGCGWKATLGFLRAVLILMMISMLILGRIGQGQLADAAVRRHAAAAAVRWHLSSQSLDCGLMSPVIQGLMIVAFQLIAMMMTVIQMPLAAPP